MDTHGPANWVQDLSGRPTISVEEAGRLLGLGRSAAYDAIRRGDIPSIRMGRRIRVPAPTVLRMLGCDLPPEHSPEEVAERMQPAPSPINRNVPSHAQLESRKRDRCEARLAHLARSVPPAPRPDLAAHDHAE